MTRCTVLLAAFALRVVAQPVSFEAAIKPVLETTCLKCHGAQAMAGLDLRSREAALKVITPGQAEASRLYKVVAGIEKPAMPMGATLTAAQIDSIRRWINEGAIWGAVTTPTLEKPWAYRRPVAKRGGSIDEFINAQLAQRGLKAAPKADHQTLIRRVALDLTGLPPEASDFALTYEQAVTKYLASPHYGERWGRHWLDVARYADSNGYEHDFNRPNAWRYRDYVIQAFNSNKPFDRFLREQIAGDELEPATPETLIATGFLRSYAKVGFREKDNPEFRGEYIDDMIATLGRGVMGLTIQCARCHNHKFDPIAKADYERIKSILWGYVEVDHPLVPADEAERWRTANEQVDQQLKAVRLELATIEKPYKDQLMPAKLAKFPKHILDAVAVPEDKRTPGQVLLANQVLRTTSVSSAEAAKIMPAAQLVARQQLLDRIAKIEAQRPAPIPVAMGITDGDFRFTPDGPGDEPAPGKGVQRAAIEGSFLHRGTGRYQVPPGEDVPPGFPLALVSVKAPVELPPSHGHTSGRRLALAEWLTAPEHPLTARVFVNRIWHHHFGRGIVASLDNFGKMGEAPTHPELLDWLAVRFVESGWDVKKLHRTILLSDAYQRSAGFDDAGNQMKDAANDYLWRFRAQRLEAEVVRDQILAASGSLNRAFGGPAVFPPLPPESLAQMKNGIWERQDDGPSTWRRSVYVYRKRGLPFPLFEVFDLPDQNITCNRRNTTTVPTQALTLLNNDFVLKQAARLAARISEQTMDPARRVEMVYQATVARAPLAAERELALKYLATGELAGLAHVLFNTSEFLYLR